MAIFTGTWNDPAGVPFIATAFPILAAGGGQVARLRPTRPRRTATQNAATYAFRNTLILWNGTLSAAQRADWEAAAESPAWSGRKGVPFAAHGPSLFARSCVPPTFGQGTAYIVGEDSPNPYLYSVDECVFNSADGTILYSVDFMDPGPGDQYTGMSLFQIDPPTAGLSYERQRTHYLAGLSPWPNGSAHQHVQGPAFWNVPAGSTPRVLVAAWNRSTFWWDLRTGTRI